MHRMNGTRSDRLLGEARALDWLAEVVREFKASECTGSEFTRQFNAHLDASPFGDAVQPEALMNVLWEVPLDVHNAQKLEQLLAQLQAKAASRRKSAMKWKQQKC